LRFEDVIDQEPHRTLLKEIFNVLIERLGIAVVDLGQHTAGDATALSARRKPEEAAQEEVNDGLPQASGGRKEYKDDEGRVTKVVEWFGFKVHLLVDVKNEVVLAVHAAFATLLASAPRRERTLGKIRLSPIAEALRAKAKAPEPDPALAV